ncbi:MAG TPA: type 2 isopentenyl-diphosphate Delta-isomerase [Candidatus Avacidaminococcus intestinavium]|uniref:Isopentenyl-diphosphate delta-isomerase n=1 Tax=Candidatus Avacidaminococcus intestinavium TaxID=2840684 RepID=A0A9D1SKZ0_9FIRM|nr:type 2 isopentenyl-diphosphate Delta-isomerase [Candidatus Avacidaminococcus intestinavium]
MVRLRIQRKEDHLKLYETLPSTQAQTGFNDISFVHNSLPEISFDDVTLDTAVCQMTLVHPLIINALTGGSDAVTTTNASLAKIAAATSSAMAVGSQYGAIKNLDAPESFKIVRKVNPKGIIFANLSAKAPLYFVEKAVDMIEANALQIHLNTAQELAMAEGDRDFTGYLKNIEQICRIAQVPVIIKETGSGLSKQCIIKLLNCGVQGIDVGGAGGTDFIALEAARSSTDSLGELFGWGIPTATSLTDAYQVTKLQTSLIASGGIITASDAAKSLALGADAFAIAGNLLTHLTTFGIDETIKHLNKLLDNLKIIMVLTGSLKVSELKKVPLLFTGTYLDHLKTLGLNPVSLAKSR